MFSSRTNSNKSVGDGATSFSGIIKKNRVWMAKYTEGHPPAPSGCTSSPQVTASGSTCSFMENDSRCVISLYLFTHLKYLFETAYGLILKRDLCGTSKNSLLPTYGFPRASQRLDNALYVTGNAPPIVA